MDKDTVSVVWCLPCGSAPALCCQAGAEPFSNPDLEITVFTNGWYGENVSDNHAEPDENASTCRSLLKCIS